MVAYRNACQSLADALRSRVGEQSWADASRLIAANEAPIALGDLAHALERLPPGSVNASERQRFVDLIYGTDEAAYLPPSFKGMKPSADSW